MKYIATIIFTMFLFFAQAQKNTLTDKKWKLVSMEMDGIVKADAKKDKLEYQIDLDSLVKNDKDPETSKSLLVYFFEGLLEKMKRVEFEFRPAGVYVEINNISKREKKGTYTIQNNTISIMAPGEEEAQMYTYTVTTTGLTLTGFMERAKGKKCKTTMVYEAL